MDNILALLLTLALGLFLFLGAFIVFLSKNSDQFVSFSISLAFGVMVMLLGTDLLPESYEFLTEGASSNAIWFLLLFLVIGFVLLKALDHFIPDHDEEKHTKKEEIKQMKHIGLVSSIALVLHNMIEGMAIFTTFTTSLSMGFLISLGVGLHNIPLGMVITSTFYKSNNDKKKTLLIVLGISLATFVGGILMYFITGLGTSNFLLGSLLALTSGMLVYICLLELLPKMIHNKDRKLVVLGTLMGILLIALTIWF